jgi:riboflavin transporter FmnP
MNILNAIGRSDLFLKVDLSKLPVFLVTIAVTVPFGINVVVIGNFFTTFVSFFINTYYPGRLFGFGAFRQIKEMLTVILATALMSVAVFALTSIIPADVFKLIGGAVAGIVVYLAAAYFLKIEELKEVNALAFQFINKRKRLV